MPQFPLSSQGPVNLLPCTEHTLPSPREAVQNPSQVSHPAQGPGPPGDAGLLYHIQMWFLMVVPLPSLRNDFETGWSLHRQANTTLLSGKGREQKAQGRHWSTIYKSTLSRACVSSPPCVMRSWLIPLLKGHLSIVLPDLYHYPLRGPILSTIFLGHICSGLLRVFTALWVVSCWIDL